MEISVVVCTYNRSGQLDPCLRSLKGQQTPRDMPWEIVVVDNNSADNTAIVVKRHAESSATPIRYLKEMKQGLSHARNAGIEASKGKFIAFIDDDAVADPAWVASLRRAFDSYRCDCVGGKIRLVPVTTMPRWLTKDLWGFLACLDYGDEPFRLVDRDIYGTNMAFTRDVFRNIGVFDPELGRKGYVTVGCEETDMVARLRAAGGDVYYEPTAVVEHIIEEYKLQRRYFRLLHYHEGFSTGLSFPVTGKTVAGIPLFAIRQMGGRLLKWAGAPTMRNEMNIFWDIGFITACRKASLQRVTVAPAKR